jgi:membrane fusion protein, heavy metal efflux system
VTAGGRALAFAALLAACGFSASRPARSPPAEEVDLEPAPAPDPPELTVETPGRVEPDEALAWPVPSPVTGQVVAILVRVGQRVKKGDPLATIRALDVVHATSDLQKAEAEWIAAQHDFARQKVLCEIDCVAAQLAAAEDDYRKARAAHERARDLAIHRSHGVADAQQSYTLPSPADGEVLSCDVVAGEVVDGQYEGGKHKTLFVIGAR